LYRKGIFFSENSLALSVKACRLCQLSQKEGAFLREKEKFIFLPEGFSGG